MPNFPGVPLPSTKSAYARRPFKHEFNSTNQYSSHLRSCNFRRILHQIQVAHAILRLHHPHHGVHLRDHHTTWKEIFN